ncbi:CBL-interacting serine/threonine-protein kinase 10 [Striga hermonthica]|uniref:non-specific serine/threonine protein kinase n=1 Tax=Striga hermonthica TaxID=68872 RepID=A0A9N7NK50_STRHE|nr:CBL-interacting serine/threonine-protein kinase 10 [Striga hermonthica]
MEEKGGVLMQKYELGKLLGQGTFAKVYHARDIKNGNSVAIKVMDKEKISKGGLVEQIKREISIMSRVRHPNIVQLYEVMATKTKIYFVMEYMKGGELFNKVAKGKLNPEAARKYFQQLISAVDFCHSRGVYHRDLKPENLLLDENGDLKVSDFGLSALPESRRQDGLLHTMCGTPAYVAPEVVSRRGYDGAKADIWSCGVILFVLLAGYLPFHDSNLMEMYRKIGKGEFKCPVWVPPDARRLISKMLDTNPSTRISMSKIMNNSWFRRGFHHSKSVGKNADNDFVATRGGVINLKEEEAVEEENVELGKPVNLNAFEIISLSAGFDLSGMFEEDGSRKKEVKFTTNQPIKIVISKLEELAERLKMKVMKKKHGGFLKIEGSKEGRKGVLSIDADIFEVGPDFRLVEMRKSNGDTLEYRKLMDREIRPALKDIVWAWQGDDPRPVQQLQLEEPESVPTQVTEA